jgi:hypothetical protein
VVVETADLYADTGGGGPPTSTEVVYPVWFAFIYLFRESGRDTDSDWRYVFSWPDPPPLDILKVPIFAVVYP